MNFYDETEELKSQLLRKEIEVTHLSLELEKSKHYVRIYMVLSSVLFAFALLCRLTFEFVPEISPIYLIVLLLVGTLLGKYAVPLLAAAIATINNFISEKIILNRFIIAILCALFVFPISNIFSKDEKLKEKRQELLEESVYITTTGNKYHSYDCYLIDKNFSQEISFYSAYEDGFTPCQACNPMTMEDVENALASSNDVKALKEEIETLKQENSILKDDLAYIETSYQEFKETKGHFVDEGIYYHNRVCIVDLIEPNSHYHKFGSDCSILAPYIMTIELAESPEINKTYCPECYKNDNIFLGHKSAESYQTN